MRAPFTLRQAKQALKQYYDVPLEVPFKQFRSGLIYFAVGLISLLMASNHMASSANQEIVVLLGLALTAIGFVMAMLAQMRILISRIVRFWTK